MFNRIAFLGQIVGYALTVTLRHTPLCTHQTKGRRELPQALGQHVSCLIPELPITLTPILTVDKNVAEFYH
jgi:hypothetical protein